MKFKFRVERFGRKHVLGGKATHQLKPRARLVHRRSNRKFM